MHALEQKYNQILQDIGFGRYQWVVFITCGLAGMSDGCQLNFSQVMTSLSKDIILTDNQQNFIGSMFFFGVLIGSLIIGPISDAFGRKIPFLLSSMTFFIFSLFLTFIINIQQLLLCRTLIGISLGSLCPISFIVIAEQLPLKYTNRVLSLLGINYVLGCCFGNIFSLYFLTNWRIILLLNSLFPFLCTLMIIIFLYESPTFLFHQNTQEKTYDIIKKICQFNNNNKITEEKFEFLKLDYQNKSQLFSKNKSRNQYLVEIFSLENITKILYACIILGSINFIYFGINFILPRIMQNLNIQQKGSMQIQQSAKQIFYTSLSELPTNIVATIMSDIKILATKRSLFFAKLIGGISCYLIFQFPMYLLFYISIAKFCFLLAFTLFYNFMVEIFPSHIRTTGVGLVSAISRIGSIMMPWILQKNNQNNEIISFKYFSINCLVSIIMIIMISKEHNKNKELSINSISNKKQI